MRTGRQHGRIPGGRRNGSPPFNVVGGTPAIGNEFPITLGPLAFWLASSTVSSGSVADLSGHAFALSQSTSAQRPTFNSGPNRLTFDGVDDNLQIPFGVSSALAGGNTFSLVIGFKGTNISSSIRLQPDSSNYIILGLDQVGVRKCIVSTDAANTLAISGAEDGNLHQLVWTWQRNTTNGSKLYIDNAVSVQSNVPDVALPALSNVFAAALGAYLGGASPAELTTGSITHAMVFDRVLTAGEVSQLYTWHLSLS